MPVQDIKRTIVAFNVKPAIYGGYGIYATGTQTIDDGPRVPFVELFAVGSDEVETGERLTSMLTQIKEALPDGPAVLAEDEGS